MADVELLPLPSGNVAHLIAAQSAEIETLRAEVARKEALLETGNMFREAMCNEMRAAGCKVVATPDTIEVRNTRAERLAEALREIRRDALDGCSAMDCARNAFDVLNELGLLRDQEEGHE